MKRIILARDKILHRPSNLCGAGTVCKYWLCIFPPEKQFKSLPTNENSLLRDACPSFFALRSVRSKKIEGKVGTCSHNGK